MLWPMSGSRSIALRVMPSPASLTPAYLRQRGEFGRVHCDACSYSRAVRGTSSTFSTPFSPKPPSGCMLQALRPGIRGGNKVSGEALLEIADAVRRAGESDLHPAVWQARTRPVGHAVQSKAELRRHLRDLLANDVKVRGFHNEPNGLAEFRHHVPQDSVTRTKLLHWLGRETPDDGYRLGLSHSSSETGSAKRLVYDDNAHPRSRAGHQGQVVVGRVTGSLIGLSSRR